MRSTCSSFQKTHFTRKKFHGDLRRGKNLEASIIYLPGRLDHRAVLNDSPPLSGRIYASPLFCQQEKENTCYLISFHLCPKRADGLGTDLDASGGFLVGLPGRDTASPMTSPSCRSEERKENETQDVYIGPGEKRIWGEAFRKRRVAHHLADAITSHLS